MVRWRSVDDPLRTSGPRRRVPILALLAANAVSETGNVLAFVAIPWFVLQYHWQRRQGGPDRGSVPAGGGHGRASSAGRSWTVLVSSGQASSLTLRER